MLRRLGAPEEEIFVVQTNISNTYVGIGRLEEALQMDRDVYYGFMRLFGEEYARTIHGAICYANSLVALERFGEAKALLRKRTPMARRVLGESHVISLGMRWIYAKTLYLNASATLGDLREAVTTLQDAEPTARRVFGGAHPITEGIEFHLRNARAALCARETPPRSA